MVNGSGQRRAIGRAATWVAVVITTGGLLAGCSSSKEASKAASGVAIAAPPNAANLPAGNGGDAAAAGGAGAAKPADPGATQPATQPSSLTDVALANRSLIFTAGLTVRVKDVLSAVADADRLATANGGFPGDEKSQSGGPDGLNTVVEAVVTLRVPSDKFEAVLSQLGTGGVVEQQSRTASDVTDQVVDTTSRIASEQIAIARLADLIKTAGGLSDIITLEGELSRRESDLDSMKSRLAGLQDQVQLSTITVTYHTPAAPVLTTPPPAPKKHNAFVRGLTTGWHAFEQVAKVLLVIVGGALPFALLLAILWWPARRLYTIRLRALARIAQDRADIRRSAETEAETQRANGERSKASAAAVADGSR